jgi:ABC-2 type transport system permease protein
LNHFKAFSDAALQEISSIANSYYKLFLVTLFPLISFVLVGAIFYSGVLREIPIAVIDKDKSELSRRLLSHIQASPTMKIATHSHSVKEATALLRAGRVYAVVVLPSHFEKEIKLLKQPQVTAMINAQYILIGKILTSALSSTVMQSAAEVEYVTNLLKGGVDTSARSAIAPIGIQVTPFFNTYQNYFYFLVLALIPSIWQIFIVIATIVAFGSLFKLKKEGQRFFKEALMMQILGTLAPYTLAYLLWGGLYLFSMYGYLGWVFKGSMSVTLFAMFITVVAYQAVALLLFVTGFDYARSLSLGAVYTAPAFAFLGVTFPVYSMNDFALLWRELLPISHYIEIQISQANYGADITLESQKIVSILLFWLLFIPVYYRFKKRLV